MWNVCVKLSKGTYASVAIAASHFDGTIYSIKLRILSEIETSYPSRNVIHANRELEGLPMEIMARLERPWNNA